MAGVIVAFLTPLLTFRSLKGWGVLAFTCIAAVAVARAVDWAQEVVRLTPGRVFVRRFFKWTQTDVPEDIQLSHTLRYLEIRDSRTGSLVFRFAKDLAAARSDESILEALTGKSPFSPP